MRQHSVHSELLLTMSESESQALVPAGVHKIHNVKYAKDTQVADLIKGGPGPIDGRKDSVAHNDKVCVVLL